MKKLTLLFILLLLFLGIPTIAFGASSSLVIRPNGDAGTNQWNNLFSDWNYENVDEELNPDVDYLFTAALNYIDQWTMQDVSGTILAGAVIDSVVLSERGKDSTTSQGRTAYLKVGSDSTWGTQRTNTVYTTYNEKLAAPGTRTWTRNNLDSLLVSVKKTLGITKNVWTSQAYVTVYYTPAVSGVDTVRVFTTSDSLKCSPNTNTDYKRYKVMYLAGSTAPDSQNQAGISYGDASTADNDTLFLVSPLSVNTQYSFSVFAKNADSTKWTKKGSGSSKTIYTKANAPDTPTVANPACNSMSVTVRPNGNPATTQFAIYTLGQYVQANGTLNTSEVWQDSATWETIRVIGLHPAQDYFFKAKARNGDNTEAGFSGYAAVQTTTDSSIATACTVYVVADSTPKQWSQTPSGSSHHYSLVDDPPGSADDATTMIHTSDSLKFDWFKPDTNGINCVPSANTIDSVVVKRRARCSGGSGSPSGMVYTYLKAGSDSVNSSLEEEVLACGTGEWTNSSWSRATHPSGAAWTKTNLKTTILGIKSKVSGSTLPTVSCTQIYYIIYHTVVSLSITASPTTWDLDTLNPSQIKTMVTSEKIKVKNTGSVAEQLSLKISDMDTKDEWACTSSASGQGVNKYVMNGVFRHKDSTTSGTFNGTGNEDVIDTLTQWASSDTFAVGTQAVGANVTVNDSLYLWLQMKMPTTASGPKADSTRNIIIEIGCQQAP
ncbi:MAG: hypothetical protein MUO85_02530 [candidate division Zixibacteria bacterium]|nr:hypothetical protein [candidate division Zixibacteria bacterium]